MDGSSISSLISILVIAIFLLLFYIFMVRPQQKREREGTAVKQNEFVTGRSMAFIGFGVSALSTAVSCFILLFFPSALMSGSRVLIKILDFTEFLPGFGSIVAAIGFLSIFKHGRNILDLATAGALGLTFVLKTALSIITPTTPIMGFLSFIISAAYVAYLLPWALKYFMRGNLFMTALLGGTFIIELVMPYIFRTGVFGFSFVSVLCAIFYIGCAAVPVLGALCESED